MPFTILPDETILRVLKESDAIEVSRRFRDLVAGSLDLQYIIELDMCGYVMPSVARTDLSLAEKIDVLRKHRKSWQRTELSQPAFIKDIPQPGWNRREEYFINGTYAFGQINRNSEPGLQNRISFRQLPSLNRATGPKCWHHAVLVQQLIRFMIQPEHDLLVLLEETNAELTSDEPPDGSQTHPRRAQFKLHLRTMSTNEPHPAVSPANAEIIIDIDNLAPTHDFLYTPLQICGRMVATALDSSDTTHIVVYNWLTGQQMTDLTMGNTERSSDFATFHLHSEDYVIIPHFAYSRAQSNDHRSEPSPIGRLKVYKICDATAPQSVVEFILPGCHPGVTCLASFHPPSVPSTGSLPSQLPKIFESPPGNDLLRISISIMPIHGIDSVVIPSQALLSLIDRARGHPGHPAEVPWEAWGHLTTRLDLTTGFRIESEFVRGRRMVSFAEPGAPHRVRIWDLDRNRVRMRRAKSEGVSGAELDVREPLIGMFFGSGGTNHNYTATDTMIRGLPEHPMQCLFSDEEHIIFKDDHDWQEVGLPQPGMFVYTL